MGASGDLAPLAHLALGMMGEGKMWSAESGWGDARYVSTDEHPSCVNYYLDVHEMTYLPSKTQLRTG